MKLKCNFDFKFKNPPRVLSCIFGFEVCFFKLEFKPGVGGGFLRAFASQKGPGKGLPASGFAPETREKPRIPPSHNSTLPLPKPLGSSRIRPPHVPDQPRHSSSQPRPDTTPHPSPGRPQPPLIPVQVGPDPYPGPVPRLDTPRFPYKAQKQLQAHIKPNPPATKDACSMAWRCRFLAACSRGTG